jgi:hypothetical protein
MCKRGMGGMENAHVEKSTEALATRETTKKQSPTMFCPLQAIFEKCSV